jgi:hypothetical protein
MFLAHLELTEICVKDFHAKLAPKQQLMRPERFINFIKIANGEGTAL